MLIITVHSVCRLVILIKEKFKELCLFTISLRPSPSSKTHFILYLCTYIFFQHFNQIPFYWDIVYNPFHPKIIYTRFGLITFQNVTTTERHKQWTYWQLTNARGSGHFTYTFQLKIYLLLRVKIQKRREQTPPRKKERKPICTA